MGMSASQVRFLSLQSRKNRIGTQLTSLSNRKLALSRDMNKVARTYNDALNQTNLKWSNDSGASYNQLTYDLLMKPNDLNSEVPYIVSTRDGRAVLDSTENLIGRTYDATTGEFSDYQALTGSGLSYKYFADKITNALTLDGTTGSIYTTTDGLIAGTANKGAYVVPSGALDYGFENTLRYEIFEELGLVSPDTTKEYKALLNRMYGSEEAYKYGNYASLLENYINNGIGQSNRNTSLNVNGTDYGTFATNFGYIDTETDTWAVDSTGKVEGSLMGNLALAELAISEYDTWCNTLKEFNLASDTSFTFTATSGRTNTQTVQAFTKMNNNVDGLSGTTDDDGGIANDFQSVINSTTTDENGSATVTTVFKSSWLNEIYGGVGSIKDASWYDMYMSNSGAVALTTQADDGITKAGLVKGFIDGLEASMDQASTSYTGTAGNAWSFDANINSDSLVDDGSGNLVSPTEAAKTFARNKTIAYYGALEDANNNYSGCGSCHGDGHRNWVAAGAGDEADNDIKSRNSSSDQANNVESAANVLGSASTGRCFWHGLVNFAWGLVGGLVTSVYAGIQAICSNGGGVGNYFIGTFSDAWQGDGKYYTLNMANVQKTYYTYYQMYMNAYQNGENLLSGDYETGTSSEQVVDESFMTTDINNMGSCTAVAYNVVTHTVVDANGNPETNSDGSIKTYQRISFGTAYDESTFSVASDGNTIIDTMYYTFSGGKMTTTNPRVVTYTEQDGSVSTETQCDMEIYFTNAKTATITNEDGSTSSVQYNVIKKKQDGTCEYGYKDANGNYTSKNSEITKTVYRLTDSYGSLKIAAWDTKFTTTISAYITPDTAFQQKLEDDRQAALDAIEELKDEMKNFFSAKETKMMDYYDAIFLRIAESGWVNDDKVNTNTGVTYLNNKLQNNDYFITVCKEKTDESGYDYTAKMASTVTKIFEVNDDAAQQKALSKYESDKALISSKETKIDTQMSQLETEQEAINTEMTSVQKMIEENVQKTFKIFA